MKKGIFFFFLAVTSCVETVDLSSVDYGFLFHDSNSKVWMINRVMKDGENVAPYNNLEKDLMIFHRSNVIDVVPLKDLMETQPRKGSYSLNSESKTLSIDFRDRANWNFDLEYITEDSILLVPTKESELQYSIQLMPFPEL